MKRKPTENNDSSTRRRRRFGASGKAAFKLFVFRWLYDSLPLNRDCRNSAFPQGSDTQEVREGNIGLEQQEDSSSSDASQKAEGAGALTVASLLGQDAGALQDSGSNIQQTGPPSSTDVTYPNPKNFAERLMSAMEMGVAQDSIFWVGDGKAVALHKNSLKKKAVAQTYFKVSNYGALLRNLNRW